MWTDDATAVSSGADPAPTAAPAADPTPTAAPAAAAEVSPAPAAAEILPATWEQRLAKLEAMIESKLGAAAPQLEQLIESKINAAIASMGGQLAGLRAMIVSPAEIDAFVDRKIAALRTALIPAASAAAPPAPAPTPGAAPTGTHAPTAGNVGTTGDHGDLGANKA